ncbi:DUF4383 domain-containing protein [Promicromonospora sp. NPDC050262]|uniref:DUF4383 domain-containing protein n=1 Tax=Promicromonospora sp. NPDC050262 TaxID=3155036 RepID=UPI0033C56030
MTQSMSSTRTRGVSQWLALTIGVVYLLVGAAGFLVTGFSGFAEHDHEQTLLGFAVNPLHNVVHLLIGVLGISLWSTIGPGADVRLAARGRVRGGRSCTA